jgi:hypothetical protein
MNSVSKCTAKRSVQDKIYFYIESREGYGEEKVENKEV